MGLFDRWRFRFGALRRDRLEGEFDEELQFHVDALTEELVAQGIDFAEARRRALVEFGGPTTIKEDLRAARGVHVFDVFSQDVRHGVRLLQRNPGFAAAALLTVALGIGATTAVFSVVYGVVLKPLPYPESNHLVSIWTAAPRLNLPRAFVGVANYRDWRDQATSFESMALVRHIANFNLTGTGEPERVQAARVTASLFDVLRVQPALGRAFRPDEEEIAHDSVVILSDGLWRRRFAADPRIVGRRIFLDGRAHEVVGVMPPHFAYPSRDFQLFTPLTASPEDLQNRMAYSFRAVGRLKPSVSIQQAQAEMDAISARLERQYPTTNQSISAVVVPMLEDTVADVRRPLLVLLGAVASLLLIGCASLANLLIARAMARSNELVLRSALGARRTRLIGQSLSELVPLLAVGGAAGVLLAHWAVALAVPHLPANVPRVESIAVGGPVLLFAAAALACTAVVTGVWPALQVGRLDIAAALRESLRGAATSVTGSRLRDALVVSQVAAAALLSVCAALLVRSFVEIRQIDPGFQPEGVVSLQLEIPRTKYAKDAQMAAFCREVLERVRRLPGITAAGMVNRLPLAGVDQIGSMQFDRSAIRTDVEMTVDWRSVSPEYFRAIGIPVLAGRTFTDGDNADAPLVGVIDDRLAQVAWPNESPIGRRMRIGPETPWITIVGVVGHIRHSGLTADPRPQVYWSYLQRAQYRMALVVRTDGDPDTLARMVAAEVREVDRDQAVYDVRPMTAVVDRSISQQWLTTTVLASFAVVALLMAGIGVYGVVSYGVAQRSREFGIRMALGATRAEIVTAVLRRGVALAGTGLVVGIAASLLVTKLLTNLLFDVTSTDAASFVTAVVVLGATALVATALPARRAVSLDPMSVLRE